jgi:hypothetical protein
MLFALNRSRGSWRFVCARAEEMGCGASAAAKPTPSGDAAPQPSATTPASLDAPSPPPPASSPAADVKRQPSIVEASRAAIEAEMSRVKCLPEEERAAVGKPYTDAEELFLALEAGGGNATLILRASWVKKQRGGRLPKRGDKLPPEATITVDELRDIAKASTCNKGALPVIALSHFWRTKENPDPDGETLELVIDSLEARWEEFQAKNVTDLGILVDYCALWQAPRETPEKQEAFQKGLKAINQARAWPST